MAILSPPASPVGSTGDVSRRRDKKDKAIAAFCATPDSHAYSSPAFLRRFLELQMPELSYPDDPGCSIHTMLLLRDQTYDTQDEAFLSLLCAESRYHFHVHTYKTGARSLNDEHPTHMLIPCPTDQRDRPGVAREFICASDDCLHMVKISVLPPIFHPWQIDLMRDEERVRRNLEEARKEDSIRYADFPAAWCSKSSTITTLAQYIEDRLKKPIEQVLKIKKRNKRFRVSFGTDLDGVLSLLGFEERLDEDNEECWYITEPNPIDGSYTPVNTRRAFLQDALEELRSLLHAAPTTPAWSKLMTTFPGYTARPEVNHTAVKEITEEDLSAIGCLREFPPQWFSWAAIVLAGVCPSRRDAFLDTGLRCIGERNEDASMRIILYKSEFDHTHSSDPKVKAACDFFGIYPKSAEDSKLILNKVRNMLDVNASQAFRTEALQHLETIDSTFGFDLSCEVARSDSLTTAASSARPNSRRMSIRSASRLLNVDASYTADMIREFTTHLDGMVDRERIVEALEVLSELKLQQDQQAESQSLQEAADFVRATGGIAPLHQGSSTKLQSSTTDPIAHLTTPPGLKNIGNTCYLNSLLQYFYNVKPVRDMVLNYDKIQLELDDNSVSNRRTGGNGTGVTLEEAIVARQFIEELRRLFSELQTTTGAAASPSQKLANTALSSAKEILTSKDQSQPPPLPARPSSITVQSTTKDTDTVNVTVESIRERRATGSSVSSQTLVNETGDGELNTLAKEFGSLTTPIAIDHSRELSPEDRALSDTVEHIEDTVMEDSPLSLSLEQKFSQIAERLEHSDRSGTSQQDVGEIIGNILEHLMRAILPNGPMEGDPNLQSDKITELFFTTVVYSTVKTRPKDAPLIDISSDDGKPNEEVVPERWITAFPHSDKDVKIDLYEALNPYFSYELLSGGDLARYATIRNLPPILHICIQRTDVSGVKNKNPVIIPDELYLDRYMEATPGSNLANTRQRVWAIRERIKELNSRTPIETNFECQESQELNKISDGQAREKQQRSYLESINLESELWQDIPQHVKHTSEAANPDPSVQALPVEKLSFPCVGGTDISSFINTMRAAGREMDDADNASISLLSNEETRAFDSMKQHKFLLHAIICHGGGMKAGHYWVWVRDFKNNVWYKYNDSLVTKDSRDSQQVVDELNNSGDPYYVAYVKEELKDELVEVPQRVQGVTDDVEMTNVEELEVIDSIAISTPPQPANSPVNTPVAETVMEDAPQLKLQE
ncbi:hypothetical protein F5Y08DRAFT_54704 [Xylaria arbuscula]|nr:hypothetical protein F5Y08DRAFT_54704 [Xylaria arbuscula]